MQIVIIYMIETLIVLKDSTSSRYESSYAQI